jgi:hypothetical protein
MQNAAEQNDLDTLRNIEAEITESLALLGRWSYLYEKLHPGQKRKWQAIVASAQGSRNREAVRTELDGFINTTIRPLVERLD